MNQQKPHWTGWRHHIIMRCLVALLLFGCGVITGMAQEVKLTGSVIGANDGAPLIGATVKVAETGAAAITDADGAFTLDVKQG